MNAAELTSTIDKLVYECHQNSVLHGFYDCEDGTSPPVKFSLMHSEVTELLTPLLEGLLMHQTLSALMENFRKGRLSEPDEHCPEFTNEEIEVADLIIRACDYAGWRGLRVAGALLAKHEYNKKRPYLHNKSC